MSPNSYTTGRELGRGALGRVVVVTDDEGNTYAGKILHESHQADERATARFAGEAEIAKRLEHPNLARIYGLAEIDGESVLLMELAGGESLATIIATSAPLEEPRLLRLGLGLAAGLEAAHHAGLIHRDLKPDNVLTSPTDYDKEQIKIVDFGLARAASFFGVDDDAFAVVGTPDYMAPESVDPLAVDARSDLYALGCILYELATAEPPFSGATAFSILEAHRESPLDTKTLEALLSPALTELIVSLLAKSPADRPQSAAQVHAHLEAIANDSSALTVAGMSAVSLAGTCAECGAPSIPEVGVCFGCGLEQVRLAKGRHTLFVTGPGQTSDKLDTALRQRLVDWLESNPAIGISPGRLAKVVPRLPFVFATKVSEASGRVLASSLESMGFEVTLKKGGRLALKEMRKKGFSLGGRFALIGVSSLAYGLHNLISAALVPIVGAAGLAALGGGFVAAVRPAAKQTGRMSSDLPGAIAEPLARVTKTTALIEHGRHRESLRGVVQRALAIRDIAPEGTQDGTQRGDLELGLGQLIDRALGAVLRIDAIDTRLEIGDLRNATTDERNLMLERDALAARLLEISAFLDAMRVRYVSLAGGGQGAHSLDELRAHVEALEEIEAL